MAIKGVVIDPGHGGTDPGAISNGLKEKDFSGRIAERAIQFKVLLSKS